ncbi:endopeptidase lytE, partial [Bacillus toyonensis]
IHLPPKIGALHLHIFEEGVFCRKTINLIPPYVSRGMVKGSAYIGAIIEKVREK